MNSTTNHRYISLTETDHCNFKPSKNIQFEKDIHFFPPIFEKICKKINIQKSYFGRIESC